MRALCLAFLIGLAATAARAADRPVLAPPEAWVKPAPKTHIPTPTDAAVRWLVLDEQAHLGPSGQSIFYESRVLAQTAQGLGPLGTIALAWNPETESLTVHKVQILRGDKVIDMLAGRDFTVLRRETNLDMAMLDGVLTATLQIEGLQVGDVLDLSFTRHQDDPVLGGRSEAFLSGLPNAPIQHMRLRGVWSRPKALRWRASDALAAPKVTTEGGTTQVEVDLAEAQPLVVPKGAPARFQRGRELEFTEFSAWSEISTLFAPLYTRAATLGPASPLAAEIATIKAASPDPKARAMAALALVQDKIRYVFLGMNDGGLAPAAADVTWSRRFGDCKAKTALLIALLNGIGISAQPALVSSSGGDGLDQRLPNVSEFDHILVRAALDGEVYWLDGTRTGDRDIADLRASPFHWALPVQAAGGALTPLPQPPLDKPQSTVRLSIDSSAGLDAPASVTATTVMRGDLATKLRLGLANAQAADADRALKGFWKGLSSTLDPKTVSASFDPATGEETLTMQGKVAMTWDTVAGGGGRKYAVDAGNLGSESDFKRDPGPHQDAPFVVMHPAYVKVLETITLPQGGKGFTLEGGDVDATAAGMRYQRTARIEKGVFSLDLSTRSLVPEFPAAQAEADAGILRKLSANTLYIHAPAGVAEASESVDKLLAQEPTTAAEYIARGSKLLEAQRFDRAIADFDKAIALDATSARAYADRGVAHFWTADRVAARADLDKAASLDANDLIVLHGRGLLDGAEGNFTREIVDFTRAIDQDSSDAFALARRAFAWWAIGDIDNALADSAEALRQKPRDWDPRTLRAQLYLARGDSAHAVAELDAALASAPDDTAVRFMRARLFWMMGRAADARREVDAALAIKSSVFAYICRAAYADRHDAAASQADFDAALKLEPRSSMAWNARIRYALDHKDGAKALTDADQVLQWRPDDKPVSLMRAQALVLLGRQDEAIKTFAAARTAAAGDASALNNLCWAQATFGVSLTSALADCNGALKIAPTSSAYLDSRAFVHLRLGDLPAAMSDYNEAVRLSHRAASLFGRGVVEKRLGLASEAATDIALAKTLDPEVEADFAGYGVKP